MKNKYNLQKAKLVDQIKRLFLCLICCLWHLSINELYAGSLMQLHFVELRCPIEE